MQMIFKDFCQIDKTFHPTAYSASKNQPLGVLYSLRDKGSNIVLLKELRFYQNQLVKGFLAEPPGWVLHKTLEL